MLSLQLMVRSPHVLACFKRLTVFSERNTVAKRDYFAFLQENRPELPYDEVELEEMNEEGADIEAKERGVAYVRWGRRDCPTNAELVYAGRAAGSFYAHSGGGSNYQCIVENPKNFDGFGAGTVSASYIYGAEYEVWGNVPKASLHLHEHDVPCAVCYVADRTAKIMVPGTYLCPRRWTTEYVGYLMAERHNHQRSTFECVDKDPEKAIGGHVNHNGALFYFVEPRCGSLPCPPYDQQKEMTCAVCTR